MNSVQALVQSRMGAGYRLPQVSVSSSRATWAAAALTAVLNRPGFGGGS
jgi:hypothetical protein